MIKLPWWHAVILIHTDTDHSSRWHSHLAAHSPSDSNGCSLLVWVVTSNDCLLMLSIWSADGNYTDPCSFPMHLCSFCQKVISIWLSHPFQPLKRQDTHLCRMWLTSCLPQPGHIDTTGRGKLSAFRTYGCWLNLVISMMISRCLWQLPFLCHDILAVAVMITFFLLQFLASWQLWSACLSVKATTVQVTGNTIVKNPQVFFPAGSFLLEPLEQRVLRFPSILHVDGVVGPWHWAHCSRLALDLQNKSVKPWLSVWKHFKHFIQGLNSLAGYLVWLKLLEECTKSHRSVMLLWFLLVNT